MHTFIDEAGRAITSEKKPVACVTALIVPDTQIDEVNKWFTNIEREKKELIKGRKLDFGSRRRILSELQQFDVFIECAAIDMKLQTDEVILNHKEERANFIGNFPHTKNPFLQKMRTDFENKIRSTSNQLYIQSILNHKLVELVLRHSTIYYSQRRPEELEVFHWVIDRKEPSIVTGFEKMWTELVLPYLQCQPSLLCIIGQNYSFFEKYTLKVVEGCTNDSGKILKSEDHPIDLKKIMKELSFQNDVDTPGLRLVDVIANTLHRMLNGGSESSLYDVIGPLFFKRTELNCISLMSISEVSPEKTRTRPYRKTIQLTESRNRSIWV